MAIKIASAAEIAAKYKEVTPGRQRYYEQNAPAAGQDWESAAIGATSTFLAGIQASGIEKRYAGGIRKVGAEKYSRKVKEVGAARYGPGVQAGAQDYQNNISDYVQTIAGLSLPKKGPRGDPSNIERVRVVANALAAKRLALIGAG